uniref:Synaptic vesicle membrane protein VAT-1-like protein n=1 Tax=Magallana gigas TaxID=29159 RepID=K1Q9Q6_MAGGI
MSTEEQKESPEAAAPAPREVKCVVLTGFGGPKMVRCQKKPEPSAKEGEIGDRVIGFCDYKAWSEVVAIPSQFVYKMPENMSFQDGAALPMSYLTAYILLFDIANLRQGQSIGDRVIGFCDYKAWSEVVAIPSQFVYKMPENMSFQDGAALPMSYLTAYILLFDIANLRQGQSVFTHSVGGGVGIAVTQLCHMMEDVKLFGTASYQKHEAVKANVDHLFDHVVDYPQEVRKLSPEGVDIFLDCLCGEDANKGISLLKPMGKYILYGSSSIVTGETKSFFSFAKSWWQVDKISPIKLYDENKTIAGFQLRHLLHKQGQHQYVKEIMNKLIKLYSDGKIRPCIDSAWAFEDVGEAMQKMQDRKNIGKIILDPTLEPKPKPVSPARTHTTSQCSEDKENTEDQQ